MFNVDKNHKANSVSDNTFDNTTTAKPRHNMLSTIQEEQIQSGVSNSRINSEIGSGGLGRINNSTFRTSNINASSELKASDLKKKLGSIVTNDNADKRNESVNS